MSRRLPQTLSKSRFLSGLQCPKRLWTEVHARNLLPPVDPSTQARFDQGNAVGVLAQKLFPGGLEIGPGVRRWGRVVEDTRRALALRRPLYEAAFRHAGAACRVDILVPVDDDRWDVVEVKSSTSVKPIHVADLALQATIIEASGLAVRSYQLAHIDTDYVRRGALDLGSLFRLEDLTERVRERCSTVDQELASMQEVLASEDRPRIPVGRHCLDPYRCPLHEECWSFLPPISVFDLVGGPQLAFERLDADIIEACDLPDSAVANERQRIQLESLRTGSPHVDGAALARFLDRLEYPVSYFDIESFAAAVPPYDETRPYQQIPFLFSIHRVEGPEQEARHYAYRFEGRTDPRADFLRACRSSLGEDGSIVAYNAAFEKRLLQETAMAVLPEIAGWAAAAGDRFVDLWNPFRDFSYHHPDQLGSASLKAVLAPLTGMTYADLEIADGEQASLEYQRSLDPQMDPVQRQKVLGDLERYCSVDTLGMVAIVEKLEELATKGSESAAQG